MRNLTILLLILGIGFGFVLCQKPNSIKNDGETELSKDIAELEVNDDFKWKTIKDIQVSLQSSSDNVALIKSIKGDTYLKVFLKANEILDTKITIPTYVTEVIVVCANQSQEVSVVDSKIDLSFN